MRQTHGLTEAEREIQWQILFFGLKINHWSVRLSGLEACTMCSCHHRVKTSSRPLLDIICFLPKFPVMFRSGLSSEAEVSLWGDSDALLSFEYCYWCWRTFKRRLVLLIISVLHEKPQEHEAEKLLSTVTVTQKKINFSHCVCLIPFCMSWLFLYQCVHYAALVILSVDWQHEMEIIPEKQVSLQTLLSHLCLVIQETAVLWQ